MCLCVCVSGTCIADLLKSEKESTGQPGEVDSLIGILGNAITKSIMLNAVSVGVADPYTCAGIELTCRSVITESGMYRVCTIHQSV